MNLALFFEGTGHGVHGKKTNVSLVYEACEAEGQSLHLEAGPGTNVGYFLSGAAAGHDWRKIFASARRWFEANYKSKEEVEARKVFLFGFSRGALLARHFAAWLDKLSIEVEYMGLWDTVDATPGLEVSEMCPPNVKFARHAVAEHEARRFFAYVPLWGREVEEELFPGSHSDVGGLYEDNHELADAARAWIVQPAVERGLRLRKGVTLNDRVDSKTAIRHDSLRHLSNFFGLLRPAKRLFPKGMKRHVSAILSVKGNGHEEDGS